MIQAAAPGFLRYTRTIALVIAGVMAVVCVLNAFPSIFGLPTPGPYPAIILRPAIFFGCVLAYLLYEPAYVALGQKYGSVAGAIGLVLDVAQFFEFKEKAPGERGSPGARLFKGSPGVEGRRVSAWLSIHLGSS